MHVLVAGGGIGGLTAALSLHAAGIDVEVAESARRVQALGVGINLLPHAMRELSELGLGEAVEAAGIAPTALGTSTASAARSAASRAAARQATAGRRCRSIAARCRCCCWTRCASASGRAACARD